MYFIKFLHWLWNDHLRNGEQRVLFCLAGIVLGIGPTLVLAWFFGAAVILWYIGLLVAIGFFVGTINFSIYVHRAYVRWQEQVFNKLRDGKKN